ncbi:MAG: carbohydrate-binding domain-containing protein [Clostridia bacterium]|nr:carbohydrate-binding domain-containing protein [Clostridia bacterium]
MRYALRFIALLTALVIAALATAGIGESAAGALPQFDDYFTERDLSGYWDATAEMIVLTGDSAECASHVVSVEGGTVTIMDGGVYVLSGTLSDGSIVVDVKDDERVQLVLNGVSITSLNSAAIRVVQADKVFITLAEGTENTLANVNGFDGDSGVGAVIFSDEDLTFNGTGALSVISPAGDGIDGNDDIKFISGSYAITASGRGVNANDSVRIAGGSFTIESGEDAVRASHDTKDDLGYIYIWGGSFTITTNGGAANGASASTDAFPGMMPGGAFAGGEMPEDMELGDMPTPPEGFEMGELPEGIEMGDMPSPPERFDMGERPEGAEMGEMPSPPEGIEMGEIPEGMEMGGMPRGFDALDAAQTEEEDAPSAKGFKASGDITILGGEFNLDTADDAFHADGSLTVADGVLHIASGDDGLHADGTLTVAGGSIEISQSAEGLEGTVILIQGGITSVYASDDGLNAADSSAEKETFDAQEGVLIAISGGTLYVNADGDGIDSNGDLSVTGGTVVVSGPANSMNGALDYNGTAIISGGTVIAAGASGMAEGFSEASEQPSFLISLSGEAGEIRVLDADGGLVLAGSVEKSFGTVVVSSPALTVGEAYTVTCGDASAEITLTDTVTSSDEGASAVITGPMPGMGRQQETALETSDEN